MFTQCVDFYRLDVWPQHVTSVSGQCFYQLRQLRSVRQSLDTESTTTLIRAFVSSRVDYCCSLFIGSPRSITDKLQRVLNAAARVITNTKKYESGLSRILHHDLHRLDVTERILFRVAETVYQCLHGMAPAYLTELCTRWVRIIYSMRSLILSQRRDLKWVWYEKI